MSSDVFQHPWLGALFGDAELADILSPERQIQHMLWVEATYLLALAQVGRIEQSDARAGADAILGASLDVSALAQATERDGVVVPDLVRQLRNVVPSPLEDVVHTGLTSQDVIDTALVLALKDCCAVFEKRIADLGASLDALRARIGTNPLMGRTRMQRARAITVADRLDTWRMPLDAHMIRLAELRPRLLRLQMGGAVGTRDGIDRAAEIAAFLAQQLDLGNPAKAWHAMRDPIAELAGWLSLVSGTTGKMGQDIALMAQQGVGEVMLAKGGGSSAMPHKQNPVVAETLVTLARFNATLLPGVHQALVHEQERSGAAWALEWMLLPQMIVATGRALHIANELTSGITEIGTGAAAER